MTSNFDRLPVEIEQMVFGNLKNSAADKLQCALVCERWKLLYEKQLYTNVCIVNVSQLKKFVATIRRNFHLSSLVKKLTLFFEFDFRNYDTATIVSLFKHLVNLKSIDCARGAYFKLLSDALMLKRLPRLHHITPPENLEDYENYITCTLLSRRRLQNLKITDSVQTKYPFRLFDILERYKNINDLHIENRSYDIIKLIEKTTANCPSLKYLHLEFPSDDNRVINLAHSKLSEYLPLPNVSHVTLRKGAFRQPHLLLYTIQKFPRLQVLKIFGPEQGAASLDESTLNKFLDYISRIRYVTVQKIPCNKQAVYTSIGPFWKTISKSRTLSVEFWYQSIFSDAVERVEIEVNDKHCKNQIFYSHDTGLRHVQVIEKYGHHIDRLTLSGLRSTALDPSERLKSRQYQTLYQISILHPLKYCTKLKQLTINSGSLIGLDVSGYDSFKKPNFDSLHLRNCTIEDDLVFEKLSVIFDSLKHLELYEIKCVNSNNRVNDPYKNIDFSNTNIGTLSITKDIICSRFRSGKIILLELSIQQRQSHYMYNFNSMHDLLFKPIVEEVFNYVVGNDRHFTIGIKCKTLQNLNLTYGNEVIKLFID